MAAGRRNFWRRNWLSAPDALNPKPTSDRDWAEMGTAFGLDASFEQQEPTPTGTTSDTREPSALESMWAHNRLNGRSVI